MACEFISQSRKLNKRGSPNKRGGGPPVLKKLKSDSNCISTYTSDTNIKTYLKEKGNSDINIHTAGHTK